MLIMRAMWRHRIMASSGVVGAVLAVSWLLAPGLGAQQASDRIVFETEETGQLATINPDGSGLERVRTGHYSDQDPQWSPDRSRIAFYQGEGDHELFVSNHDGLGLALVSPPDGRRGEPWIHGFDWSPDSTKIVYARTVFSYRLNEVIEQSLIVHDLANGDETVLMHGEHSGLLPVWSPNGFRIAFVSTLDRGNDIFTIAPDGSELTQLTRLPRWSRATDPQWSPDGSTLTYERRARSSYDADVMLLDIDTGERTALAASDEKSEGTSRWSPSGNQIAFVASQFLSDGYRTELIVLDLTSREQRSVLKAPDDDGIFYAWSSDASRIVAAVGGYTEGANLWVLNTGAGEGVDLGRIAEGRHLDW